MWEIELRRGSITPMARQLYQALRDRMTGGMLKPGEALPSTRELAHRLGISRNTACEAYSMLADEGFLVTSQGAPTRVAEGLMLGRADGVGGPAIERKASKIYAADFKTGQPDLRLFPAYSWQQMLRKGAESLSPDQLGYAHPEGLPSLREEIARWLLRGRGLAVDPQDVFVTAGSTHAIHMLGSLPELKAKALLAEDPCHTGLMGAWKLHGYEVRPVPADEHGLRTSLLEGFDTGDIRAIYVTPSHQFPLGGILPASRRAELIRFARMRGLYVIEDDYDSEFRYAGAPVAPLRSMDGDRVVYVGTFSKTLFPALRIGYAVLPEALQKHWLTGRAYTDIQNPPFEQAALAEFLRTRRFDRHVQRMRRRYGLRRDALLQALEDDLPGKWKPVGDAAGLHVAVQFPGMRFGADFMKQAREAGIRAMPVEAYAIKINDHQDKLVLGFGHMEPEEIIGAVRLLRDFLLLQCQWQQAVK